MAEVVILKSPADRFKVVDALEQFARLKQLPAAIVQAADLALEEHLTNAFSYGFAEGQPVHIEISFSLSDDVFIIDVADSGKPFNPLDRPEPDIGSALEDREVGGLGIHLIRQFMDELAYKRESQLNRLIMKKRISLPNFGRT